MPYLSSVLYVKFIGLRLIIEFLKSSVFLRQVFYYLSSQLLIHVQLFVTPWTVAQQAPLSMEFPRKEYWSG